MALHIGTVYVLLTFAVLLGLYFFRAELGDELILAVLIYVLPGLWLFAMVVFVAAAGVEVPPRPAGGRLLARRR